MAISADKLAAEMAARLSQVSPSGCTVVSEGSLVLVTSSEGDLSASAAASVVEELDGRSDHELLETASSAILSGTQDAIARILKEPWPVSGDGSMGIPESAVEGDFLRLWFRKGDRCVLELPALRVGEIST